jgi:hypothetical protein
LVEADALDRARQHYVGRSRDLLAYGADRGIEREAAKETLGKCLEGLCSGLLRDSTLAIFEADKTLAIAANCFCVASGRARKVKHLRRRVRQRGDKGRSRYVRPSDGGPRVRIQFPPALSLRTVGPSGADIAKIVGCAPKTLRKRFRVELDRGVAEVNAMISGSLFTADKAGNITAIIGTEIRRLCLSFRCRRARPAHSASNRVVAGR